MLRSLAIQKKDTSYSWATEFGDIFADRKILVTGATGFVGSHLCDALVALGAEVHGLSLDIPARSHEASWKPWIMDLTDLGSTQVLISQIKPQTVFHMAGLVDTRQEMALLVPTLQSNLVGTLHLLMAVAATQCERVLVTGSSEEPEVGSIDGIPTSPYAASKGAAVAYSRMFHFLYQLPVVIARPFMCYGPRKPLSKLIPYTIVSLLSGERPQLSSGRRVCDLVYVLDLVRGLLKASAQIELTGKAIDLGTGDGIAIRDVVALIAELTGSTSRPIFGALPDRLGEGPQVADLRATQQFLDWQPLWSLREGLIETIDWYRTRGSVRKTV